MQFTRPLFRSNFDIHDVRFLISTSEGILTKMQGYDINDLKRLTEMDGGKPLYSIKIKTKHKDYALAA